MKINFTHNEKEYTLCSISEFAEMILKYLCKSKKATKTEFVCDFALSDIYDNDTIDMDRTCDIIMHASGWFGIKELGEIGFNNTDSRQLVLDYYGGQFNSFHSYVVDSEVLFDMLKSWGLNGLEFQTESHRIEEILCLMLDTRITEYKVLVQWTEDEWLGKIKKDEPRKEEYDPDEVCGIDWHNEQVLIMQDQIDDLQKQLKELQDKNRR